MFDFIEAGVDLDASGYTEGANEAAEAHAAAVDAVDADRRAHGRHR